MSRAVLDSSALLAVLGDKPGADAILPLLDSAAMSTVNLAEVHGKLRLRGIPADEASEAILSLIRDIHPFDYEQASLAGSLIVSTQHLGLSLGDRACLALAGKLGLPVYTTDQAWGRLQMDFPIHLIR